MTNDAPDFAEAIPRGTIAINNLASRVLRINTTAPTIVFSPSDPLVFT